MGYRRLDRGQAELVHSFLCEAYHSLDKDQVVEGICAFLKDDLPCVMSRSGPIGLEHLDEILSIRPPTFQWPNGRLT